MQTDPSNLAGDPLTRNLIAAKLQKLMAKAPFTRPLREDIEQELLLTVHRRTRTVNRPLTNARAFLGKLIDRCLVDLLRRAHAARRDYHRIGTLHVLGREEEGAVVELANTLPEQAHQRRLFTDTPTDQEREELAWDVADLLRTLPPELRHLAEQLKSKTLAEVARACGIARSTLQGRVRKLRQIFEQASLNKSSLRAVIPRRHCDGN